MSTKEILVVIEAGGMGEAMARRQEMRTASAVSGAWLRD